MTTDMLRRAPRLVMITFLVFIVAEIAKVPLPETDLGNKAVRELIDLVRCAALVPIEIALYRLLLLAEPALGYSFDWRARRFRRFLAWSLVFQALAIPFMLFGTDSNGDFADGAVVLALLVLLIAGIYAGLRLMLLLPALAVGPEGTSWRDAWADSRGRLWWLIKILLVPLALMVAVILPGMMALEQAGFESGIADLSDWRAWMRAMVEAAMSAATELLIVAAGALSFLLVGDRVKQDHPPTLAV